MEFLSQLNEKQLEAVHATEGYVRVIAGAGSGKTKLLVSRYAYLVKDYGIDSANILCVTFTNKAAGEMKKRIRALIGSEYDTTLICTYHGFCARLLRENPEKLFMTKGFQIIDTVQQKSILEEIYQKHELKLDHASFESILKKIGVIKNNTDYVTKMCDPRKVRILDTISDIDDEIIEEFMQRQKAIYALDFHDGTNPARPGHIHRNLRPTRLLPSLRNFRLDIYHAIRMVFRFSHPHGHRNCWRIRWQNLYRGQKPPTIRN